MTKIKLQPIEGRRGGVRLLGNWGLFAYIAPASWLIGVEALIGAVYVQVGPVVVGVLYLPRYRKYEDASDEG